MVFVPKSGMSLGVPLGPFCAECGPLDTANASLGMFVDDIILYKPVRSSLDLIALL